MRLTIKKLKKIIKESLTETPSGPLRRVRGTSGRQHKIGKIEDENVELSPFEAEQQFPGSTSAWTEIVPELFPEFPFNDPFAIKKNTSWFKIGPELRVAFTDAPQIEVAKWDPSREDWIETDFNSN